MKINLHDMDKMESNLKKSQLGKILAELEL